MEKKRIIADILCINRKPKIDINSDVHGETISVSPDISFEYSSAVDFIQFIERYLVTVYQKNFYLNIYNATDINSGKIELGFITDDMTATVFISEDISDKVEVVYYNSTYKNGTSRRYRWTYLFNVVDDAERYVENRCIETLSYLRNNTSIIGDVISKSERRTDCGKTGYYIAAHDKNKGTISHSWFIPISQEEMHES